ncbi:A-agglutinin anchorage subunit-like [Haliotis rufescens]|uniref:A-agglutinin anchorage subunit-like n=1 Tax=Haliotis rufescens TaxID=6454 RepID=UPI00201EDABD|nr:A-agglutinin anchorage subunit-like [Haliotis rufescens]XP_048249297.1 A-agglutinin anchorage subunit-like [Haliotis rufescens]
MLRLLLCLWSIPVITCGSGSNMYNAALWKHTTQSSVLNMTIELHSGLGVDGVDTECAQLINNCSTTQEQNNSSWDVSLGHEIGIYAINITTSYVYPLGDFVVERADTCINGVCDYIPCYQTNETVPPGETLQIQCDPLGAGTGGYVIYASNIRVRLPGSVKRRLSVCEVEVYTHQDMAVNVALNKTTHQSSVQVTALPRSGWMAVDGKDQQLCSATQNTTELPWWQVDLESEKQIEYLTIKGHALENFTVYVGVECALGQVCFNVCAEHTDIAEHPVNMTCEPNTTARYVKVALNKPGMLSLCEVKVWVHYDPTTTTAQTTEATTSAINVTNAETTTDNTNSSTSTAPSNNETSSPETTTQSYDATDSNETTTQTYNATTTIETTTQTYNTTTTIETTTQTYNTTTTNETTIPSNNATTTNEATQSYNATDSNETMTQTYNTTTTHETTTQTYNTTTTNETTTPSNNATTTNETTTHSNNETDSAATTATPRNNATTTTDKFVYDTSTATSTTTEAVNGPKPTSSSDNQNTTGTSVPSYDATSPTSYSLPDNTSTDANDVPSTADVSAETTHPTIAPTNAVHTTDSTSANDPTISPTPTSTEPQTVLISESEPSSSKGDQTIQPSSQGLQVTSGSALAFFYTTIQPVESVDDLSEGFTTQISSLIVLCSCYCKSPNQTTEAISRVNLKNLAVDKRNVSRFKRRFYSVLDERPSAISIGSTGIFCLVFVFCLFVLSDVDYVVRNKNKIAEGTM